MSTANKDRLVISFSGGKTSAYMTHFLLSLHREEWKEIVVCFMNTGQEHEKTLEYVDKCDLHYGFNVVWLEAIVNRKIGEPTGYKIVNFKTASSQYFGRQPRVLYGHSDAPVSTTGFNRRHPVQQN